MRDGHSAAIHVFISYRHADHRIVEKLRDHLGWLENSDSITVFDDSRIVAGDDWDCVIRRELGCSDIVILVVTAAFMRSPYCTRTELKDALTFRSERGVRVIPIIAETLDWEATPLGRIAALPKDQANDLKPLNRWRSDLDVALTQIAQQVRQNVESIRSERTEGQSPYTPSREARSRNVKRAVLGMIIFAILAVSYLASPLACEVWLGFPWCDASQGDWRTAPRPLEALSPYLEKKGK